MGEHGYCTMCGLPLASRSTATGRWIPFCQEHGEQVVAASPEAPKRISNDCDCHHDCVPAEEYLKLRNECARAHACIAQLRAENQSLREKLTTLARDCGNVAMVNALLLRALHAERQPLRPRPGEVQVGWDPYGDDE